MAMSPRRSAFTYKGKAVDLKQMGRKLNVRYVLEGSVQRGGNRIRKRATFSNARSPPIPTMSRRSSDRRGRTWPTAQICL
jgi:hypothetical protein